MIDHNLVLASASPRRKELLDDLGLDFTVEPSNLDESKITSDNPRDLTLKLAENKASKVAASKKKGLILAADTIVYHQNKVLEKPDSLKEAEEMLKFLRNKKHSVITGVCLLKKQQETIETLKRYDETLVEMRDYSSAEIRGYVDSREPMGKAGGYAIQGLGSLLVKKIEGSYFTVVGLPLHIVGEMMAGVGAGILD